MQDSFFGIQDRQLTIDNLSFLSFLTLRSLKILKDLKVSFTSVYKSVHQKRNSNRPIFQKLGVKALANSHPSNEYMLQITTLHYQQARLLQAPIEAEVKRAFKLL
jgi:hypothetical protein